MLRMRSGGIVISVADEGDQGHNMPILITIMLALTLSFVLSSFEGLRIPTTKVDNYLCVYLCVWFSQRQRRFD